MTKYIAIFLVFGCFFYVNCFAGDYYIGIMGGGNGNGSLKSSKIDASAGYYLGGRIGYQFLSHFRLEEELSYQRSGIHSFETKSIQFHHIKGDIKTWSLMTNLLLDLDFPFLISPYFGGGIGYVKAEGDCLGEWKGARRHFSSPEKRSIRQQIEENGVAWQVIAGLKYFVCFSVEVSLEYRYFKLERELVNHRLGLALTKIF